MQGYLFVRAGSRVRAALRHCFRGCAREIDYLLHGIASTRTEPAIG